MTHPRRPEWGRGVVQEASRITYRGAAAQRVAVQFANKGRVVINTAVAPLVAGEPSTNPTEPSATVSTSNASTSTTMKNTPASTHTDAGWLNALEQRHRRGPAALAELPESLTDPFLGIRQRLENTLESFRFTDTPRGLIDWAVSQSGLDDPLSKYTRHELEEAFTRFARQRDQHLQTLVRTIKQKGETEMLTEALRNTRHRNARQALQKLMR